MGPPRAGGLYRWCTRFAGWHCGSWCRVSSRRVAISCSSHNSSTPRHGAARARVCPQRTPAPAAVPRRRGALLGNELRRRQDGPGQLHSHDGHLAADGHRDARVRAVRPQAAAARLPPRRLEGPAAGGRVHPLPVLPLRGLRHPLHDVEPGGRHLGDRAAARGGRRVDLPARAAGLARCGRDRALARLASRCSRWAAPRRSRRPTRCSATRSSCWPW